MPPFEFGLDPIFWPLAIAIAWAIGEFIHHWIRLPRISMYALVGFVLAQTQSGFLPSLQNSTLLLLANIAFALILFELGYRINLRWLRSNPWLGATSLLESIATFYAVYFVGAWLELPLISSLVLATLMMPTSPAALMHLVNEQRSSGQVTERALHLSAFSCVSSILAFKTLLGFLSFDHSGKLLLAIGDSFVVLVVSILIGIIFGIIVPELLKRLGKERNWDSTIAFAIAVILLVVTTYILQLSSILAALTFGIITRHRRILFTPAKRNFGALGNLLTVLLFVFAAATLDWQAVKTGITIGLLLIAIRFLTKTLSVLVFAKFSGISWQKGILTGIALMPASILPPLLLLQLSTFDSSLLTYNLYNDLYAPANAAILLLSLLAPIVVQQALSYAGETRDDKQKG